MGKKKIYLSLDMDALDPAFAPGTGTPEPFGLTSWDVKEAIGILAPRLVGFDIVEIAPGYDNGNTAALGARLAWPEGIPWARLLPRRKPPEDD